MLGGSRPERSHSEDLSCFDAANGEELVSRSVAATGPDFNPDGRPPVRRRSRGRSPADARVFDAANGREVARLRGHTAAIRALAFTPDGARIASSSSDGTSRSGTRRPAASC